MLEISLSYVFYFLWAVLAFNFILFPQKKSSFYLTIILVLIISVFRYGSGTDYFNYQEMMNINYYKNFNQYIFNRTQIEPLFALFMATFSYYKLSFYYFIAFHSIFVMLVLVFWLRSSSTYPLESLFVYISIFFLVWNLSALRQVIPLIIGSYLFFNKKFEFSLKYELIIGIILLFFHYTALFYFVLIIIKRINWTKKILIGIFFMSLITSLISIDGIILFVSQFSIISSSYYFQKLYSYIIQPQQKILGFWDIYSLMRIFFILIYLVHYDMLAKVSQYTKKNVDTIIVGLSFFFFLKFNLAVSSRMTIYSLVLVTITLPEVMHIYKTNISFMLAKVALIILCGFFYFKDLYAMKAQQKINDGKWYVEYHSIFTINSNN